MHLKEEALQEMQSNMDTPGNCANWIVSWNGFCHVYGSLSDGRGGWGGWECPYNQCVNLNLTVFVQGKKKKNQTWNYYRNYSVTLLIIKLCSLLPPGRRAVSSCFRTRGLGGSWAEGIFCCSEEEEQDERRPGSIPPSAVKMYLNKHWHWED